ncbi:MAG: hypothetical protein GX219_02790 [Tissierellia bacterium]|nr:hypothetical protein [Tissierellia bacterium]
MVKKTNKKSSFGVIIFLTILFVIMILAVAGFIISRGIDPVELTVHSTAIDNMVVAIPNSELHVKMGVEIETEDEKELKKIEEDIDIIREEIINITENIDEETATLPDATELIKGKIKLYLDENYNGAKVKGVYFNDYVTQ